MSIKDRIHSGETRIVYVGDEDAIKVPNIMWYKGLKSMPKMYIRDRDILKLIQWFRHPSNVKASLKWILSVGWKENRREAKLTNDFSNIVVPTRHSLGGGAVNIMDAVPIVRSVSDIERENIAHIYGKYGLSGAQRPEMEHPFFSTANYGVHDGRVKMVDYGDEYVEKLLVTERRSIEMALAEIGERVGL